MKPTSIIRALVVVGLACAGCSGTTVIETMDAGRDGGAVDSGARDGSADAVVDTSHPDVGPGDAGLADAFVEDDAATDEDAAVDIDAALDIDAAVDIDAAILPDAGRDAAVIARDSGLDMGTDAGTDTGVGRDAGLDAGSTAINGCMRATATDLRGMAATSVAFGGVAGLTYSPPCIIVSVGTNVTFNGSFVGHPLQGGTVVGTVLMPAASGPFVPATSTGTTATFAMTSAGTFPYYCAFHGAFGMAGVVFVE